jgi:hypothetical protein
MKANQTSFSLSFSLYRTLRIVIGAISKAQKIFRVGEYSIKTENYEHQNL